MLLGCLGQLDLLRAMGIGNVGCGLGCGGTWDVKKEMHAHAWDSFLGNIFRFF